MRVIKLQSYLGAKVTDLSVSKLKLKLVTAKGSTIVHKTNILYLKSDSNYCKVHFIDGSSVLCSGTLKSIFERLKLKCFCRVHASYVVNIHNVVSVNGNYSLLTLDTGQSIPISRANKKGIREKMVKWFD